MAQNVSNGEATGGAEATLYDASGDATWLLFVDLLNMVDGDTLVLRAKSPGEGGTYRTWAEESYSGAALSGLQMAKFGPHAHSLGVRYTLEQSVGTGKDYTWRLEAL